MIKRSLPKHYCMNTLEKLAIIERGRFSVRPRNNPAYYNGQIPFVQTGDVSASDKFLVKYSQTLNDKGVSVSKVFSAGTILVTIAANIGDAVITTFPVACPDSVVGILAENCDTLWLYYTLVFHKNVLNALATQNAQKNINLEILKPLKIPTPPLPEQEKIAEILSCWDVAIEQMQNLIAEKKEQRRALADKLLSDNQWSDIELCELLNYEQPSKYLVTDVLDFNKEKVPVLTANKSFFIGSTDDKTGVYDKGECVIFDDFTTDMKYVDFKFKIKSSAIKILTPKTGTCLRFVFEQMRRIKYPRGGHKRYWLSEFQYLTIGVPDIAMQNKIADILSKADAEIDLLTKKLDVLKEQKKGLMQKLLTGEIRVKVDKKD